MKRKVYTYKKKFTLEKGGVLNGIELAYTTQGKLNSDKSNVVWITHALTANANPEEWWPGLVGKGKFYNPEEHFIICANMLGSHYGSTGPLSEHPVKGTSYYRLFPEITIRDIVGSLQLLKEHLGISKINTLIGGSMGGQQAVEWAIQEPEVIDNLILLATNAKHSPWGIAFNESQRLAIQADRTFYGDAPDGGQKGLKAARSIALLSYRTAKAYNETQSHADETEDYPAASYQQYQGEKLVKRFNAYGYWYLSKAMDSHNVGRNRGGVKKALQKVKANTLVIAVAGDILFSPDDSKVLAKGIPGAVYAAIDSLYGHDGFLIETKKIQEEIKKFQGIDLQKLLSYEYAN